MNLHEKKEILEEVAREYLYALRNSNPVSRDEKPSVYINQGKLLGLCRVFNLYFEEELRRKISFYKGTFQGEGKFWFEVVDEAFTEEEMKEIIQSRNRESSEINRMLRNL